MTILLTDCCVHIRLIPRLHSAREEENKEDIAEEVERDGEEEHLSPFCR